MLITVCDQVHEDLGAGSESHHSLRFPYMYKRRNAWPVNTQQPTDDARLIRNSASPARLEKIASVQPRPGAAVMRLVGELPGEPTKHTIPSE